jgi:DnaJ-class molecular chaperone
VNDYDLCWFCDGSGDDGDWYCRVCKGQGVAERWVMEAESQVVGWSECFASADDFYDRTARAGGEET